MSVLILRLDQQACAKSHLKKRCSRVSSIGLVHRKQSQMGRSICSSSWEVLLCWVDLLGLTRRRFYVCISRMTSRSIWMSGVPLCGQLELCTCESSKYKITNHVQVSKWCLVDLAPIAVASQKHQLTGEMKKIVQRYNWFGFAECYSLYFFCKKEKISLYA